jgi:hypothetical protein
MTSKVEIWKLAVSHIRGESTIQGLNENSTEAVACRLWYDHCRHTILRAHPWGFSTRFKALTPYGTAPTLWTYQFQRPSDCLKVRYIVSAEGRQPDPPIAFEIGSVSDGTQVIWTDYDEAPEICYTADIEDCNRFDQGFIISLSFLLAAMILKPVAGENKARQRELMDMYRQSVYEAVAISRNEGRVDVPNENAVDKWRA